MRFVVIVMLCTAASFCGGHDLNSPRLGNAIHNILQSLSNEYPDLAWKRANEQLEQSSFFAEHGKVWRHPVTQASYLPQVEYGDKRSFKIKCFHPDNRWFARLMFLILFENISKYWNDDCLERNEQCQEYDSVPKRW